MRRLLVGLALAACQPAHAPTAVDVATEAVRLTDRALAAAIRTAPSPYDATTWESRVAALESAASVVRQGRDVCPALASVAPVAAAIDCAPCVSAVAAARKELRCP